MRMVNNKSEHTARLKENLEKQLSRLLQNLKYLRKFIVKKKSAIKIEIQNYPEIAPFLKGIKSDSPGNSRIKCDQPEILDEIIKTSGSRHYRPNPSRHTRNSLTQFSQYQI